MSVEFDEPQFTTTTQSTPQPQDSGWVIKAFLKSGIVKTKTQANVVSLIITVIAFGLSIFLLASFVF